MNDLDRGEKLVVLVSHPQEGEQTFVIPYDQLKQFARTNLIGNAKLEQVVAERRDEHNTRAALLAQQLAESSGI